MITPASLQRREYKCLIDEHTVERIRRYLGGICVVDPYATEAGRYTIDTLYLDSPRLDTYHATLEERTDRYKLRIRGYPSAPSAPVFFEVKRRIGDTIRKTRVAIDGAWQRVLVDGVLPPLAPKPRAALDNFLCHYYLLPMQPTVMVRYEREPYFSTLDDYARVTFDRALAFQPVTELSMVTDDDAWRPIDHAFAQRGPAGSLVLLELKFTSVVPAWMRRMVQALELPREAFCKYTRAIEALQGPSSRVARAGVFR